MVSPSRRMESCKSGFSLCPSFLLGTGRNKSPGDAAEGINNVSSLPSQGSPAKHFALSKAQTLMLCSWKKANKACATQQQPLHNCVIKYLQGWFVSMLLKHQYVCVWFLTRGRIWNMKIWSFGDFHIWRYEKDGRKWPLPLHTRTSNAVPGHVEALHTTPLRPHQGHELQPLNLTWENNWSSQRSSPFRLHFCQFST